MLPLIAAAVGAGASLYGARKSQKANNKQADKNVKYQKQFAQQGIQWKVDDAKKAGIHPLFALGAQTHSFTPTQVGDSMGPALASAGQDISRAMYQSASQEDRQAIKAASALSLEKAGLENDLLRLQIAKLAGGQVGPPVPTGAQSLGVWEQKPAEVTASRPGQSHIQAGPGIPGYQEADFGPFKANLISPTVSEQLEDMALAKYWLMYKGNESQIDDYFAKKAEPYFASIYDKQKAVEAAIDAVHSWANARRSTLHNARNRSFNQRRGSWGREAR